jgi:hypothetical protein
MTNSFPEKAGNLGEFHTSTDQDLLVQERDAATSEGRQILALEMIADQLGLIARHLGANHAGAGPSVRDPSHLKDQVIGPAKKGGHVPEGIERTWVETFAVGGYNYTNLELAIEEARRARKRAAANLPGSASQ